MRTIYFFFFCVVHIVVNGQEGYQIALNNTNSIINSVRGESIMFDSDNNIITASINYTEDSDKRLFSLVKNNLLGEVMWSHTFERIDGEFNLTDASILNNGDMILVGYTWDLNTILVARINASGDIIWTNKYHSDIEDPHKILFPTIKINQEKLLVSAFSWSFGKQGVLLMELNEDGHVAWVKKFYPNEQSGVIWAGLWGKSDILITKDGGYLLSHYSKGSDDIQKNNGLIIKTDVNGNLIWGLEVGGSDVDVLLSATETDDGNFMVVGHTRSYGQGNDDAFIVKINDEGKLLWSKTIGNSFNQYMKSVVQDEEGSFWIFGDSKISNQSLIQTVLIKLNSFGEFEHAEETIVGHSYRDMTLDADNAFFTTGRLGESKSIGIMKINKTKPYLCNSVSLDFVESNHDINVSDKINCDAIMFDHEAFEIQKVNNEFENKVECGDISVNSIFKTDIEVKVFPNPSIGIVNFSIQNGHKNKCLVSIYNMHGQLICTEVFSTAEQAQVDLRKFDTGIYVYEVYESDQLIKRGKLVKN